MSDTAKKSNKKVIIIGGAVLAVILVVFGILFFTNRAPVSVGAKALTIEVYVDGALTKTHNINTDAEYLGDALLENNIAKGQTSEFGLFIESVDGRTADSSAEEWWCITKGGEMLMTGADQTPIADGEQYELTLEVGFEF